MKNYPIQLKVLVAVSILFLLIYFLPFYPPDSVAAEGDRTSTLTR